MSTAPDRTEAAEYYFTYINKVPSGDIVDILEGQLPAAIELYGSFSEPQSLSRYASGKWSIREVVSHLNDTERLFVFRAMWFARGFDSPLPSFDQDTAITTANADARALSSHLEEFRTVRASTVTFFRNLPADAWVRRGTASDNPVSVNALAYIVAGHTIHHDKIVRERYLNR